MTSRVKRTIPEGRYRHRMIEATAAIYDALQAMGNTDEIVIRRDSALDRIWVLWSRPQRTGLELALREIDELEPVEDAGDTDGTT